MNFPDFQSDRVERPCTSLPEPRTSQAQLSCCHSQLQQHLQAATASEARLPQHSTGIWAAPHRCTTPAKEKLYFSISSEKIKCHLKINVKDGGVVKAVRAQGGEKSFLSAHLPPMERSSGLLGLHSCCLTKKDRGLLPHGFLSNPYQDTSNASHLICQLFCFGLHSISRLAVS